MVGRSGGSEWRGGGELKTTELLLLVLVQYHYTPKQHKHCCNYNLKIFLKVKCEDVMDVYNVKHLSALLRRGLIRNGVKQLIAVP